VGTLSGDVVGNACCSRRRPGFRGFRSARHLSILTGPAISPASACACSPAAVELAGYDKSLISLGGGVFSRSLKAIPLALEVRALLDLDKPQATPSRW